MREFIMRWQRCFGVFGGLMLATALAIASEPSPRPFDISTPQSFQSQAAMVRAGLGPGGEYAFLSTQQRARVEAQIVAMDALLNRYGSTQSMDGAQRVELYNAQESVNRILTRGRSGDIRCAWAQQTGSHIARTQCWTET
jgi:hypothetical protein